MQHAIGDHALLADGRTAALIDPDGNVAWLCWPRVDSDPLFYSLLDDSGGGEFSVRPADPGARVTARRYVDESLVLETVWETAHGQVIVEDALRWNGEPALLRRVRNQGAVQDVHVRLQSASALTGAHVRIRVDTNGRTAWTQRDAPAYSAVQLPRGAVLLVALCGAETPPPGPDDVDDTMQSWRKMLAATRTEPAELAEGVLGTEVCTHLVRQSVAVLLGLRQRGGGIVAAPTTSLPQWPRSSRTWDYRYCWLRDASLAAIALCGAGQVHVAHELGGFLGETLQAQGVRPMFRVAGAAPPAERTLPALSGYRGARPVRVGNAASDQTQTDAPAELIELAWTLAMHGELPDSLAAAASACADWLVRHRDDRDHGIWEIRGEPRVYTHSRMMSSAALHGAAGLAERGVIRGDAEAWRAVAAWLRTRVLATPAPLQLHDGGGGADAALSLLGHVGFLRNDDPRLHETLTFIEERLNRGGLLERHEPSADALSDPCAPFVFPTFWMASALDAMHADGSRHFDAAARARGRLDLWGEVVDPGTHEPLGNYPQVQSHSAFLNAALQPHNPA